VSINILELQRVGYRLFFFDRDMRTKQGESDREIQQDIEAVLLSLDCKAVEVTSAIRHGTLHVVLIIHRRDGVDIDACADVYKAVYPRLEILYPGKEVHLEVSSPGITRVFKSPAEFEIFKGLGVKLLLDEESEWRSGTIMGTSEESVDISTGDSIDTYQFSAIRKAKLDNT